MTDNMQVEAFRIRPGDFLVFCGRKIEVTGVARMGDNVKMTGVAGNDDVAFWMPFDMLVEAAIVIYDAA